MTATSEPAGSRDEPTTTDDLWIEDDTPRAEDDTAAGPPEGDALPAGVVPGTAGGFVAPVGVPAAATAADADAAENDVGTDPDGGVDDAPYAGRDGDR